LATPKRLLVALCIRMVPFAFVFIYALAKFWTSDPFLLLLIGVIAWTGGYMNARAYTLAAASGSGAEKQRISTLMSLFEYVGVYFGIAFVWIFKSGS